MRKEIDRKAELKIKVTKKMEEEYLTTKSNAGGHLKFNCKR